MHPWHDIPADEAAIANGFPVVVEIPKGSKNKHDVIEIVDAPEKIEAFMPDLEQMVGDGLITLERAEVLLYRPGRT